MEKITPWIAETMFVTDCTLTDATRVALPDPDEPDPAAVFFARPN